VLHSAARSFNDYRDETMSLLAPTGQALETIDDFIATLLGGHNADG